VSLSTGPRPGPWTCERTLMDDTTATVTVAETEDHDEAEAVEEELLVEEVSIDGMCGVY
jgi:mycofactocin precursor